MRDNTAFVCVVALAMLFLSVLIGFVGEGNKRRAVQELVSRDVSVVEARCAIYGECDYLACNGGE